MIEVRSPTNFCFRRRRLFASPSLKRRDKGRILNIKYSAGNNKRKVKGKRTKGKGQREKDKGKRIKDERMEAAKLGKM